jgi:hypothetical protein
MTATEFLRVIYGRVLPELAACISFLTLPSAKVHFGGVADADGIARTCVAKRENAYFSVCLVREGIEFGSRGHAEDAVAIPGFWADFDLQKHGISEEQALDILSQCPEPTVIVRSSDRGWHVYWLFEQVWYLPSLEENLRARAASRAFAAKFDSVAAAVTGRPTDAKELDNVSDLARVLRLPGSRNFNPKYPDADVAIYDAEGPRHDLGVLLAWAGKSVSAPVAAPAPASAPARPAAQTPPATYKPIDVAGLRRNARAPKYADLLRYLNGAPLPPDGRNSMLPPLTLTLVNLLPNPETVSADAATELLKPCIEATIAMNSQGDSHPPPKLDVVWRLIDSALSKRVTEITKFQPFKAQRDAYAAMRSAQHALVASPERKFYTHEGIEDYCKRWNISTAEEFKRRLIIAHNGAHWLLRDSKYDVPCGKENLPQRVRDIFELWEATPAGDDLDIGLWRPATQDKPPQKRTIADILLTYGLSPLYSKGSMILGESYYDVATETFWEAFTPLRKITPAYNAEIEQWLKLFGGDEHEKLFDWIATITDLSKPTCALYISGVGSAGKTMLGDGLARLWSETGATKLSTFLSRFNSSVVECPLLRAAEGLPPGCSSRDVRDVVGSTEFTLERKGLPVTKVAGCLRLIIDDNADGELLPEPEDLGKNANDAVALKFLHVPVGESPKSYLAALGGDAYTRDKEHWVDGDKIAAFALYLRDTRKVIRGSRFLVEGDAKKMTQLITLQNPIVSNVCDWILRVLNLPAAVLNNNKSYKDGVAVGNGAVKINTSCVWDNWGEILGGIMSRDVPRKPSSKKIGTALTKIHVREHKVLGHLRLHEIDLDLLFAYNAIADIVDEHAARVRINAVKTAQVIAMPAPASAAASTTSVAPPAATTGTP